MSKSRFVLRTAHCILFIGLAGFGFQPLHAKEALTPKGVPKKPAVKVVKLPNSKPSSIIPVNLCVERIWLDDACIVHFRLKNSGRGALSPKEYASLQVKLEMGKKSGRIPLKLVDPKGALSKPGGSVDYTTELKVLNVARVTVEMEAVPGEIDPKDNKKVQTLVGKCKHPDQAVNAGSDQALGVKTGDIPTSSTSVGPAKTEAPYSPFEKSAATLSLEDLYLNDNKIQVVIRNLGKERVSPKLAMQGRLKVQSGKHYRTWSLLQLDPTRGELNKGKKELHYDTGLVLKESETVLAELLNVPGKGTKTKKKRLSPQGGEMAKSALNMTTAKAKTTFAKKKSVKTLKSPPLMAKKDTGPGKKGAVTQMAANLDLPDSPPPQMTPMLLDRGIVVSEPVEGQVLRRGTTIRVKYSVRNSQAAGGSYVNFSIHPHGDRRAEAVASISHRHPLQDTDRDIVDSFYWPLPEGIPVGEDYIIVALLDEDTWGESSLFAIHHLIDPVEANLSGQEAGIRIIQPEGGETFRTGGTMPCRWSVIDSTVPVSEEGMFVRLLKYCDGTYGNFIPGVVSGNPNIPGSDSVLQIPAGIDEGLYCLAITDNGNNVQVDGHRMYESFSRTFEIRQPSGSFGEGSMTNGTNADPQLVVLTPGTGEHWRDPSVQPIKWRFYPGSAAALPGTWTITLYRYNPSTGYSIERTFIANPFDMRQVEQGGLTWWEYTYNWAVHSAHVDTNSSAIFKIGVSAMDYSAQGRFNFTIGNYAQHEGWNLKIRELRLDSTGLVAMVENVGGVSGRLDFSVEAGGVERQVIAVAPPETAEYEGSPVFLGILNQLAPERSQFECGIPFKVTVDSTNRVEESNEDDNVYEQMVYSANVPLSIGLHMPYGDVTYNSVPAQCDVDASDNEVIAMIVLKNCGEISRLGGVRVTQSGYWEDPEPGSLDGHTSIRWHDEATLLENTSQYVHHGDIVNIQVYKRHLRRDYAGRIVDSTISIYFDGDFAGHAAHNPWNILLDVQE